MTVLNEHTSHQAAQPRVVFIPDLEQESEKSSDEDSSQSQDQNENVSINSIGIMIGPEEAGEAVV